MFVQTIYQSKSRMRIKPHDIAQITAHSTPKNAQCGVTSYLYYDDWYYLHVLEGGAAQVAETMKRVASNKLHHSVKVRLMTRSSERGFEGWPFGSIAADDFELRRVMKNLGHKVLVDANVLDIMKILKRTAGRKLRTMSSLEKRSLSDVGSLKILGSQGNLIEEVLGLRS
ncbi:hypothetical protein F9L33_13385 [Amylibacter sp. SFDW26]|uniref:BLUF domain-containing protein n=1 Tax=Amylibacter sp. SFDW26 TaxID=2652722 RepID=UPI00126225F0|nr:BLUF domain-containing protein [Amylibacter sp. SFDW26]KAB7610297.1 hypothetical protein F9L33_13385 [Amylibacter sp. SFDW26]